MTPPSADDSSWTSNRPDDAALQHQQSDYERFADLAEAMGVKGLRVAGTRIVGKGGSRSVALFFRHEDFPGEQFAYSGMVPEADPHERVWLAEELATGALHRLVRDGRVDRNADGVVWLRLRGSVLVSEMPA